MRLPWLLCLVLLINLTLDDCNSLRCLASVTTAWEKENAWVTIFDITAREPLQAPVCDLSVLHRCAPNQVCQGTNCTCSQICSAQPMLILSVRLSKHILHMHELPGPKSGGEGINRHPLPLFAEARVIGVGATPMGAILLPRPSPTGAKPSTSQILTRSFGSSCSVPSRPHIQCLFEQQTKHAIRLRVSLKWRQHPSTRQQLTFGLSVSQHAPEPHDMCNRSS